MTTDEFKNMYIFYKECCINNTKRCNYCPLNQRRRASGSDLCLVFTFLTNTFGDLPLEVLEKVCPKD